MLLRPDHVMLFLDQIAETRPLEFSLGNWTAQGNGMLADSGNLPIPAATRTFDTDFLPDPKRIRSKYGYIMAHKRLLQKEFEKDRTTGIHQVL